MTNGWGPVERNRSNGELGPADGGTLTLEGVRYTKGLGVNADSDVRYALSGRCSRLEAVVGIDDEVGSRGSVVFHVLVDRVERYNSGVVTGATPPRSVLVNLAGAAEVALIVTDAGDGPAFDHADSGGYCGRAAIEVTARHRLGDRPESLGARQQTIATRTSGPTRPLADMF